MQSILHLEDIRKSYYLGKHELQVLKGITMDIFKNEYVSLMGPSGSGKSTLMNVLGCLDSPTGGKYILNGNDVSRMHDDDLAWTRARFADADPAGNRIPNAVDKVGSLAVTLRELGPWSATLQWRYLGSGALIEDNSVRSRASLTTNLRVSRRLGLSSELTLDVFNLGNRRVNDIEYFYESRLPGEAAPVADRHVHPAEPRTVRVTLKLGF